MIEEDKTLKKSTVYRRIAFMKKEEIIKDDKKIKLIDKPLTERQLKFAHLYALDAGIKSNTDIAIEAGYPEFSLSESL